MPIIPETAREGESPLPEVVAVKSGGTLQSGISRSDSGEDEWGKAQQRLILYLQSLKIPPFEILELALEALKEARKKCESAERGHPVSVSMHTLRRLLLERRATGAIEPHTKQRVVNLPFMDERELFGGIQSTPPLNRGVMVPEKARRSLASRLMSQPGPS